MKKALIPAILVMIFGVFVIGYIGNKDTKSIQHADKKSELIEKFPKQIGEYSKEDVTVNYYDSKNSKMMASVLFIRNETEEDAKACFDKKLSPKKGPKKIGKIEGRYASYLYPDRIDAVFVYRQSKNVVMLFMNRFRQPKDPNEDIEKQVEKDLALFIETFEIYN